MKALTPSKLRSDIYRILDRVVKTGQAITVERKGVLLQIVPPKKKSKFDNLKKRKLLRGDPESIVEMNWEKEWKPFL